MSFVYLDTETNGLDPSVHQVWEIAYAIDDGPVRADVVAHTLISADDDALKINGYMDRTNHLPTIKNAFLFEDEVFGALDSRTVVGANPAFDAAFLRTRWGRAPWRYRMLDVEAYAMGALGYNEPQGLATIASDLQSAGWPIPDPTHRAADDVETTRACHKALLAIYENGSDR